MTINSRLLIPLLTLLLAVPALAQEAQQTATSDSLAELRAEAQRLTALAGIPEEGRAEAEALIERAEALAERERSQEIARLEAYIAALRNGDSPAVAREVSASAVAEAGIELAREREALEADVATFLGTYPEAARAFGGGFGGPRLEVRGPGLLRGIRLPVPPSVR